MSDKTVTMQQLDSLDSYSLLLVHQCSLKLIKDRGLNLELINKPSELKKFSGGPTSSRVQKFHSVSNSFEDLMNQDWSSLFSGDYDISQRYYVYTHSDPRNIDNCIISEFKGVGLPFYVGKGTGQRFLSKTRNKPHRDLISDIEGYGFSMSEIAAVYADNLNERDALILESKLITFFGCRNELGQLRQVHFNGMKRGLLINTDTGIRPESISKHISGLKKI